MSSAITPANPTPAPAAPARLSAEEFIARYSHGPFELVDGVVKELPVPGLEHGMICMKIGALIFNHIETHDLGRVMSNDSFVKTAPDRVRGGDVLYYSYERLPRGQPVPRGAHTLAPDVVFEVKSPTDGWGELFGKVGDYLKVGVRVVVILDPGTATASVYRQEEFQQTFHNGDELTLPDVLPGFAVTVSRLFA